MREGQKRNAARALRRNATDVEQIIWRLLRDRRLVGIKFRRQVPIGPYIADFASIPHRLVIELDGGQHNEAAGLARDATRTADLEARGYRVLRFWNNDVLGNVEGAMETLPAAVRVVGRPPPTPPRHASHGGRGVGRTGSDQSKRHDPLGEDMP